ncbi:MAG TPA: hypothetical protein IAC31_08015 [Candidatus Faecousia intestinigallinarum]|nr:hypothetical protein [Candidatus Faecousia intestinigallinarum]
MKRRKIARLGALLIALCLTLTLLPAAVFAEMQESVEIKGKIYDLSVQTIDPVGTPLYDDIMGLMEKELHFSYAGPEQVYWQFNTPKFVGTPDRPILSEYHTNWTVDSPGGIGLEIFAGGPSSYETWYLVNQVLLDEITIPNGIYVQEFAGKLDSWDFQWSTTSGARPSSSANWEVSNSQFTVPLDEALKEAISKKSGKSFSSGQFKYQPINIYYKDSSGAEKMVTEPSDGSGDHRLAWSISLTVKTRYTVDIRPVTPGGTPTLSKLQGTLAAGETLSNNLGTANASYWNDGWHHDNPNDLEAAGSYTVPEGVTSAGWGYRGDKYTADAGAQEGYQVASVTKKTYDPITGALAKTETFDTLEEACAAAIEGKTELEVSYVRTLPSLSLTVSNYAAGNTWAESNVTVDSDEAWVQNAKLIYKGIVSSGDVPVTDPMKAHEPYQLYLYIWTKQGYVFDIATLEKEDVTISVNGEAVHPIAIRDGGDEGRSIVMDVDLPELHGGGTATCTEKAKCATCGQEYGELAAHSLTHFEAVAPTCTKDGNIEYWYCSACGGYFLDADCQTKTDAAGIVAKATGHDWNENEWASNSTHHYHECRNANCPITDNSQKEGYAAHTYKDGKCTVCGAVDPESTKPTEPKPTEPEPTEPKPTEPEPTEPKPTDPKPTDPTKPVDPESPSTGDNSNLLLWISLLVVSAAGAAALGLAMWKRNKFSR